MQQLNDSDLNWGGPLEAFLVEVNNFIGKIEIDKAWMEKLQHLLQ